MINQKHPSFLAIGVSDALLAEKFFYGRRRARASSIVSTKFGIDSHSPFGMTRKGEP
jgi:hypothetical protein